LERDTVIGEGTEANRKVVLLEEEGRLLKARVARLTQEKIKVERDSRAALSLARSMDTHNASDADYYKRKVRYTYIIYHRPRSENILTLLRLSTNDNTHSIILRHPQVTDLNDHLQSKNALVSELRHQVDEYRRQMERSLSQNRLSQIRGEGMITPSGNRRR
jgi:hypothetical protein